MRQPGNGLHRAAERGLGGRQRRTGQQHHELVTAVAGHHVAAAHGVAQRAGHHAQHVVALGVRVLVVDLFEPVEVDQRDGQRVVVRGGGQHGHPVVQRAPVGQPGQRVLQCLLGHRAVLAGQPLVLTPGAQRRGPRLAHRPQLVLQRRGVLLQRGLRRVFHAVAGLLTVHIGQTGELAEQAQPQRLLVLGVHLGACLAEHRDGLAGAVLVLEAAGQRDRADDHLTRVARGGHQHAQPLDVRAGRVGHRVCRAHLVHLVGRGQVRVAGEQRLRVRRLHRGGHRRGGGEALRGLLVLACSLQPQPPAEQHLGAVHQVHRDHVRPGALPHRAVAAGEYLVGDLVHAKLGEHQADVGQRGAHAEQDVRREVLVQHGQRHGRLGQRAVLGAGVQQPGAAQRVCVGLQHHQAVAAGVREHLVKQRLGLGGPHIGEHSQNHTRTE